MSYVKRMLVLIFNRFALLLFYSGQLFVCCRGLRQPPMRAFEFFSTAVYALT
jgi:hypothetical protein